MRYSVVVAPVAVLLGAALAMPAAWAQTAGDKALEAKAEILGGGLSIVYALDHCEIASTGKQRTELAAKIKDLRQQTGQAEFSQAQMKEMLKIKSAEAEKNFCRFMQANFTNMLTGLLAEKPMDEWNVPALRSSKAAAAPATPAPATPAPAAPAPAAPAPATPAPAAAAPATPAKTMVGDWELEPVADAPGVCQIARSFSDKNDSTSENAVVIRRNTDAYVLALVRAKWAWKVGQKTSAPLVTPNGALNDNAELTADKTGQVLTTLLPFESRDKMKAAEQIIVKLPGGDVAFEVPKLGAALEAMETCAKGK